MENSLSNTVSQRVEIIPFETQYRSHFESLNNEWLEQQFYIEDYDREVLQNPEDHILKPGGQILFARVDDKIVGVVALIVRSADTYELSKMGVTAKSQGLKIGQKLMDAAIEYSKQAGIKRIMLDSNRKLAPAIRLYHKVGFKEIAVPEDTPYERCDIRMELLLSD
ncbi:MAG: GNAT family N-acetyltransferase [Flavobacteriales bacterium]|nr:GNAT family N-acetyltransferase [Flavobacteriales bacterium]